MVRTLSPKQNEILSKLSSIVGKDNVLYEKEDLYCYSFDTMSHGYSVMMPDYVVLPSDARQVSEIVKIAAYYKLPIIPRGAGTNHVGGCVAVSSVGTQKSPTARALFMDGYNEMLRRLKPEKIIFFGDVPSACEGNIERHDPFYKAVHARRRC